VQVAGAEPTHRDPVGVLRELEREREVGGQVGLDRATLPGDPPADPLPRAMLGCMRARTSIVVATVLALLLLAACDGSDDSRATTSTSRRRTTTTSSSTTSTSTPTGSSTTAPPGSTSTVAPTTTTTVAAGTCGGQTQIITDAVQASDQLAGRAGQYSVQQCRIAPSAPIWAAADIVPDPGASLDRASVLLERIGAIWTVVTLGTGSVGCPAPPPARVELLLPC
jgi:hypothetical protein